MKYLVRNRNFWLMLGGDTIWIILAWAASHWLRFEGHIPVENLYGFKFFLATIVFLKLPLFFLFNLYRGMWRYTSLEDLLNILKATTLSSLILVLIVFFVFRFQGFSRSIFIIDFMLTTVFVAATRLSIRFFHTRDFRNFWVPLKYKNREIKKVLLIGAGQAGENVLREIRNNPRIKLQPVGFLDDNRAKMGKSIHGIQVLGSVNQIENTPFDYDEILITAPSASMEQMRYVVSQCKKTGKAFKTMPPLGEIIDGKVSLKMIRNVTIADVIGREEIHLDVQEIRKYLRDKRVLVTGAGGSIGSELVRQISRFQPSAIAMLDFSEFNLYQIEAESRSHFHSIASIQAEAFLVDMRNQDAVDHAFGNFHPEVVFHAAAYKHVPMQEKHPWEAVQNNLIGTRNAIMASDANKVETFVLVSSDKAVRPVNVMGATKRANELMVASMNGRGSGRFLSVRFGNVIGSSGSVIPIFEGQIERGGPVTVTHPDMTRYFMSIPEAAQLILQAGSLGEGGEIFILDMGKPIKIVDLARDVIRLKGYEPDKDIEIVFTGLRPGEKLYEELITEGEGIVKTRHEKILVLRGNGIDAQRLHAQIEALLAIAGTFDAEAIKRKLQEIVPEYTPQEF